MDSEERNRLDAESRRYEGRPEDRDFRSSDSPRTHGTSTISLLGLPCLSFPSVDAHLLSSPGRSISSPTSVCPTTLATSTSTIWFSRQPCISTTYASTRGLTPSMSIATRPISRLPLISPSSSLLFALPSVSRSHPDITVDMKRRTRIPT